MRVRSIAVSGWRCFAEPVHIGPFGDRINLIHAPNGTGKSTLFDALRRALFDGHRAGGRETQSLRPWGRELSPTAVVEFEHDGVEYRVEKRFLDRPHARLDRKEDGRYVPLAEGDAADAKLRQLFCAAAPGQQAAAGPEYWGICGVLWMPQGGLELHGVDATLSATIQRSLGAEVTGGAEGNRIANAIEARQARIFTPTGQYRRGVNAARVVLLEKQAAELRAARDAVAADVRAFEALSDEVAALESGRQNAQLAERRAAESSASLRQSAQAYAVLRQQQRERDLAEQQARTAVSELARRVESLEAARRALESATADASRLAAEAPGLQADQQQKRAAAQQAAADVGRRRAERQALAAEQAAAADAAEFARVGEQARSLEARLARVREIDRQAARIDDALKELRAPSAEVLAAMQASAAERAATQAKLDASLITLQFVPAAATEVDVRTGEPAGRRPAAAGVPTVVRGSPEVVIEIAGVGQFKASGPAGDIAPLRRRLAHIEAALARQAGPFGTADLGELQRRHLAAAELRAQLAPAKSERGSLLAGRTVDQLADQAARARGHVAEVAAAHPGWAEQPPNAAELAADAAARAGETERQVADAERVWELAQKAAAEAESACTRHRDLTVDASARAEAARASLAALEDGLTDAARHDRLREGRQKLHDAQQTAAAAREALAGHAADPAAAATAAEQAHARAAQHLREMELREQHARGRLAALAATGAYSKLASLDEQAAAVDDELARERASAEALLLLHNTVQSERGRAVHSVRGAVETRVTTLLHRIAGPRMGPVRLNNGFAAEGIAPAAAERVLALGQISVGEAEQVQFAVRLALADVLAQDQPQMVLLDDALVSTDGQRTAQIIQILQAAADRLQVILLTCHSERYALLADARRFDLAEVLAARG